MGAYFCYQFIFARYPVSEKGKKKVYFLEFHYTARKAPKNAVLLDSADWSRLTKKCDRSGAFDKQMGNKTNSRFNFARPSKNHTTKLRSAQLFLSLVTIASLG